NVHHPQPLSAPGVILPPRGSVNRAGDIAGRAAATGKAEQVGIRAAPLHMPAVPWRLRQAANVAKSAGLEVDLADRRPAPLVCETADAERCILAVATRIERGGGSAVRQGAQDPLGCRDAGGA